jgi:tRNA1Val (adenine37-N6)-methyltransferase
MANPFFKFKQFTVYHDRCAMKVTTDSCFFGAWTADQIQNSNTDSCRDKIRNVLDIGTGTGLLSLMVAQHNELEIDAVEIDDETAEQANENVEESPWRNRIRIFNKDILSFRPQKKYDCIISNPPFYENELASHLNKKNIAHHSQQLTIAQVLNFIQSYLNEEGLFFLMYPFKRKEEVERMVAQNELNIINSIILHQSVNHAPFRVIIKGCRKNIVPGEQTSISVWDENQEYTAAFTRLLKDYYLNL